MCGSDYAYQIEHEATATYDGFAFDQADADAKAAKKARDELARMIETNVTVCRCPQCDAVTPEMQAALKDDRAERLPVALFMVLASGGLGWLTWWLAQQTTARFDAGEFWHGIGLRMMALFTAGLGLIAGVAGIFGLVTSPRIRLVEPLIQQPEEGNLDPTAPAAGPDPDPWMKEECRSFAEFFPAYETRVALHYAFVYRELPERLAFNPAQFFCERPESWPARIHARFCAFEAMSGLGSFPTLGDFLLSGMVFRRISDLLVEPREIAGQPGVFITMPPPEMAPCAYFVLLVLHTDATQFRDWLQRSIKEAEEPVANPSERPASHPLGTTPASEYGACTASVFTLERTLDTGDSTEEVGVLCRIGPGQSRSNLGINLKPVAKDFLAEVEQLLVLDR